MSSIFLGKKVLCQSFLFWVQYAYLLIFKEKNCTHTGIHIPKLHNWFLFQNRKMSAEGLTQNISKNHLIKWLIHCKYLFKVFNKLMDFINIKWQEEFKSLNCMKFLEVFGKNNYNEMKEAELERGRGSSVRCYHRDPRLSWKLNQDGSSDLS